MSRQSLTKAHAKITELSWEPTFATPATRFGTDYTFEKAPKKDPLKQIMRSYFPMEEERITACTAQWTAPSAATGSARCSSAGWSGRSSSCRSSLPGDLRGPRDADGHRRGAQPGDPHRVGRPDDRRGSAFDDPDEPQEAVQEHYIDPAGFDITEKAFANNYAGTIGRQSARGSSPVTRSPRPTST